MNADQQFEIGAAWKDRGLRAKLAGMVSLIWAVYTLVYISRFLLHFGIVIPSISHRAISACLVGSLVFLLYSPKQGASRDTLRWYDVLPILWIIAGCGYVILHAEPIMEARTAATGLNLILGTGLILCFLEATRRVIGLFVPVMVVLFILYGMYCKYIPGFFHGMGFSYPTLLGWMYLSTEGIWGIILEIVSTVVSGFIIFGAFLRVTGGGEFFKDLAFGIGGRFVGGAAKAAVVTSGLFGMLSGSIAANIATTGTVTIPFMKSTGYDADLAGATETAASTGGMFMPPVMGAIAFIIAEFLTISYWEVCVAAFAPAVLYYVMLFGQVHLHAVKVGMQAMPVDQLPSVVATVRRGWVFVLPIVALIYFLGVLRYSAWTAILYTIGVMLLVSTFKKETRITPRRLVYALEDSARGMLPIIPICSILGIVIAVLIVTGIAMNLTSQLLSVCGGSLLLLLLITAAASFVLGMGSTALTCYIVTVILMAPAIINAGVKPIAAHLFLLYYGITSFITPPVCIAAYVAAGLAGGRVFRTGFESMKLGLALFIVPWAFVYNPALVMVGTPVEIVTSVVSALVGGLALGPCLVGHMFTKVTIWQRAVFGMAGITMFIPGLLMGKFIAVIAIAMMLLINSRMRQVERVKAT